MMHLFAFLSGLGHHESAWRLEESDPYADLDPDFYLKLTRIAESAHFDAVFLADQPALWSSANRRPCTALEPMLVLASIAVRTRDIGLVTTASTTYNEPFDIARRLSSLDHLSAGRAGWNIVTTSTRAAALNFGRETPMDHTEGYRRADEFVKACKLLWDGWPEGVIIGDKATGVWAEDCKISQISFSGNYIHVYGRLNVSASPQRYPVLVQAGSSAAGRSLGSTQADVIFTVQQTLEDARAFREDIHARASQCGRDPRDILVLPGIVPFIAESRPAAIARERDLNRLIQPNHAIRQIAHILSIPVSELAWDAVVPLDLINSASSEGGRGRAQVVSDLAARESLTVAQLAERLSSGRGHLTTYGTPEQIADIMQEWYEGGAADGFNIMPAILPGGLKEFCELVVPILQHRRLFRSTYSARTLRGHLRETCS
jgi:FMN-dependent oxidoreductase (nitrilotriacetate monooxygenase family)